MTITAGCDMSCQPSVTRVTWGYNGAGEENVCRLPGKFCALTAKASLRRAGAQFPRAKSATSVSSVTFIHWKVRMDVLTFILYTNHIYLEMNGILFGILSYRWCSRVNTGNSNRKWVNLGFEKIDKLGRKKKWELRLVPIYEFATFFFLQARFLYVI